MSIVDWQTLIQKAKLDVVSRFESSFYKDRMDLKKIEGLARSMRVDHIMERINFISKPELREVEDPYMLNFGYEMRTVLYIFNEEELFELVAALLAEGGES